MYSATALLDLHRRWQLSLTKLMRHSARFSTEELQREHPGFGQGSLHQQLYHIIDVEDWWLSGITGRFQGTDRREDYPTIKALRAYQELSAEAVRSYIGTANELELNTPRLLWASRRKLKYVPALVIMHTITHGFHHKGQIAAICRLLGRPTGDTDLKIFSREDQH